MRKGTKVSNGVKKFTLVIIVLIIVPLGISRLSAGFSPKEKSFLIEERILLKNIPPDASELRLWIPYPASDNWQAIEDFKFAGPFNVDIIIDKEYSNKILLLSAKMIGGSATIYGGKPKQSAQDESTSEIVLAFKAKRMEHCASCCLNVSYGTLSRFLKPDRRVPVGRAIKDLAKGITKGKSDDLEKVRSIYDYIIDELTYSKDDPKVCGIGDSLLTLRYKKGICTDYHSLFISLVRSLGIPAKFEIGFRIPQEPQEGTLNGYHCWAKFYLKDKGWIPVDISEADKYPQKRDYFFGNIDENRIHLTTGRDINLREASDLKSLNFFVYPYAELNGMQFNDMDIEISYKALNSQTSSPFLWLRNATKQERAGL